jgi:hypothetical protein
VALDLKFLSEGAAKNGRNFKSATLDWCCHIASLGYHSGGAGRKGAILKLRTLIAAATLVLAVLTPRWCLGQQITTPTPTPAIPLPQIQSQTQAYTACATNCETSSGLCRSSCSLSNTAASTATISGALSQCYINCSTQQLFCKNACTPPPH